MLTQGQCHTLRSRDSAAGDLAVVQTAVLFPCDDICKLGSLTRDIMFVFFTKAASRKSLNIHKYKDNSDGHTVTYIFTSD